MAVNKLQGEKETNQGVYSKQGNIVKKLNTTEGRLVGLSKLKMA